jgi:ATP-dependent DNA ligase
MAAPYQPMLLTAVAAPPSQDGWAHEMKMDRFRGIAEVTAGPVRLWSWGGHDMAARVPKVAALLGDVVLDRELVVVTDDGRADFELLAGRVNRRSGGPVTAPSGHVLHLRRPPPRRPQELCGRPWSERRQILDDLDLDLDARTDAGAKRSSSATIAYSTPSARRRALLGPAIGGDLGGLAEAGRCCRADPVP